MYEDWRVPHRTVITDFLRYLNNESDDFILKGGTALMTCYNLDRFSEDIDLDGKHPEIEQIVSGFCNEQGLEYRTAKDTNTVKRFMINYGNTRKPLKVEVSYRRKSINPGEVAKINGIFVYKLEPLCIMKANAYASRDRIRDLYDLSFICNNHWDEMSTPTQALVRACVENKGIEQFDYLIQTQSDELIDKDKLAADFLNMFDRLDLLADNRDLNRLEDRIDTIQRARQTDDITTRTPSVATAKPPKQEAHAVQEPSPAVTAADKKRELYTLIKETAENYAAEPERLTGLFEFGSRFYDFSVKNNMLIHGQNPHATYVQSFQAWKSMEDVECSVKRGEKGLKIFVPVKATVLEIGDKQVPLREATKEQAAAYKQGQIKGREKLLFKIGTVFDISQTTYPKERYPELYSMGYPSERHEDIIRGLTDFSRDRLNCPVITTDLQSISLRGDYSPDLNEIRLNELLEDTEKLSTLSHELGHAMVHSRLTTKKSTAQMEFEADAMGIMIQSHCGIEVTDGRKRHLADNYKALLSELTGNPETENDALNQAQKVFSSVFDTFKRNVGPMQECIRQYIPEEPVQEQSQTKNIKLNL